MASHGRVPRCRCFASLAIAAYTSRMAAGAGTGPGRANGALMSAFMDGESLAMMVCLFFEGFVRLLVAEGGVSHVLDAFAAMSLRLGLCS